ncbi:MAG: dihydroorotase [Rikenellaceae bacterium]
MKTLLKGAQYYTAQAPRKGDILIENGRIVAIEESIAPEADVQVIDVEGGYITPGLVDVHVHLREPGLSKKETIASGTYASARGGYTTVFSMPNLMPVPDSLEHLKEQTDIIERDAVINVIPYASITKGQMGHGELVNFAELAPQVGGFSDDGRGVQSDELMAQAMEEAKKVGRPIVAHCEVDELLHGGYIHEGNYCAVNKHKPNCSESEWGQVKRDVELVERIGCQYHACHLSTFQSVDFIRDAKAKGLRVSCETAPHYLLLTDDDLKEEGRFKMNPPIRSAEDQLGLINGIMDGTIEVIATDHAPHTAEEKSSGLAKSAFGIVGIECAFALCYTYLVRRGVISLEKLIELMAVNPRRLFGLESVAIEVGATADLAIFDLNKEYTIDVEDFVSMGKATPFEGWRVCGETMATLLRGEVVYKKK